LSDKYTRTKIAPAYGSLTLYAKDAMTGLKLMQDIVDPETRKALETADFSKLTDTVVAEPMGNPELAQSTTRSTKVRTDIAPRTAPYWDRKIRAVPQLKEVWEYINPFMLYGKNLGYKGNFEANLAAREAKAMDMFHKVEEVKAWAADFLKPKAVWQFFETERDGNSIRLFHHGKTTPVHTFNFLRQPKENGLCLSDYMMDAKDGQRDTICMFAVTAGSEFRDKADQAKIAGDYFKSVALLALATETAEATAEWLHRRIREDWGFPDPPTLTMQQRWTSRYQGKRYSFGYGACPNMEDQVALFQLIDPKEIGIDLTEGYMMEPEASVSALVFHHPDAAYFTAASAEDLPES
jgi:5-methyltetrahydrofolate--homocysteine methyltransferase